MKSEEVIQQMGELRYEPTRLLGYIVDGIESAFDGQSIMMDPSLPIAHLLEMNVVMQCAAIQRDEVLSRRQYPVLATSDEDLFYHMSDDDYVGMFAKPGKSVFYIYLSKEEVLSKAVKVGNTGTRRLTLPRYTQITPNNVPFTAQYPINIIVKSHGGIDIVYDGSQPSPIQALTGNRVDWEMVTLPVEKGGAQVPADYIRIKLSLHQMQMVSHIMSPSSASILKKTVTLRDKFFYARAFRKTSDGKWSEIKTTHSQQMFDPSDPTILLKVVGDKLTIELPYVYHATSLSSRELRIDVYTTKGDFMMDMSGLPRTAFVMSWNDPDKDEGAVYTAPLTTMSSISVISTDISSGGSDEPTFEERRERVLRNSNGNAVIPILPGHIDNALEELGFESTRVVDNLETRTYLATRALPADPNGRTYTGIDSAVITMKTSIEDLVDNGVAIDNGERVTLPPKTVYEDRNGVLSIVPRATVDAIESLRGEAYTNTLAEAGYLYTPLHYVLDTSNNLFSVRPYFLSSPTLDVASFKASNDTLGITVGTSNTISITMDDGGYLLRLKTRSNDVWKALSDDQVHVQLAFRPSGESGFAYLNGTLIGRPSDNERIYEFRIDTNWDIDKDHRITLTSFSIVEDVARNLWSSLNTEFSLIWSVSNYQVPDMASTEVDLVLGRYLLPEDVVGVYHETIRIRLGDELTGLWAVSRAAAGETQYRKYEYDVPATYASNVYEIDPVTKQPMIIDVDGRKQLKVLHAKGSPKLNELGEPEYQFRAGVDVMLDEHGNPIPEAGRKVIRWWDMVLFDAVYRFATNSVDTTYANSVAKVLVEWVNDTLGDVRNKLIERSNLFFQPRNTLKVVNALVDNGETRSIHTAQRLYVDLYVTQEVHRDMQLRSDMEAATIQAIVTGLQSSVVSRKGLEDAVLGRVGTDVVGIRVSGLGGVENDYDIVTLLDNTARLCSAKTLTLEANGQAAVVDSITVEFKLHSTNK